MMADIQRFKEALPGIDCGSCGAPTCRAFAEDVIKKTACPEDCLIKGKRKNNDG
jgi:Na+-translocating ferredoxin:NAD+ oxidoreductase RNF subunit RnfB